jgi:hypothetical protein
MSLETITRAESIVKILKSSLSERKELTDSQREEIENLIASIQVNKNGFQEQSEKVRLYPSIPDHVTRKDTYLQGLEFALTKAQKWLDQEWKLLPGAIDRLQPILNNVRSYPKTHWDLCQKKGHE